MTDEELRKRVEKHDRDLYVGNGRPALCVRIAVVEKELETMNKAVDEIRKDNKAIMKMVIGLILAVAGQIIVRVVFH